MCVQRMSIRPAKHARILLTLSCDGSHRTRETLTSGHRIGAKEVRKRRNSEVVTNFPGRHEKDWSNAPLESNTPS